MDVRAANEVVQRLRKPGGSLGTLSVVSAAVLAVVGIVGFVVLLVTLLSGADWWSEDAGNVVAGMVFFALAALGAVGLVIEDQSPWSGAVMAVVGGLALAMVLFWTVLAIVLGLGAATVAVLRARAFRHGSTTAAHPA